MTDFSDVQDGENHSHVVERLARQTAKAQVVDLADGTQMVLSSDKLHKTTSRASDAPDHHIRRDQIVHTTQSFIDYVNSQMLTPTVYFDHSKLAISAQLDGHHGGVVGNEDHSVSLAPVAHEAFITLKSMLNDWQKRGAMAETLRKLSRFVMDPEQADLMTLVQHFQVAKTVEFEEGEQLKSGERTVKFVEKHTASGGGGAGEIPIPDTVRFSMPLHLDGPKYDLECSFRYNIDNASLVLRLDFDQMQELKTLVYRDIADEVARALPSVPVINGVR